MKRIVPYNADWNRHFIEETEVLSAKLGMVLVASHHIGSTAIPNLSAKPIIDVLLEVSAVSQLDECTPAMKSLGYEARGEYGVQGRRYFSKRADGPGPGFHVHAYEVGDAQVRRHLAFCEYLKLKSDIASEYASLKQSLSDEDGVLNANYQDAKKPWVEEISQEALRYFSKDL